jgi:hypothetical protein
VDLLVDSHQTQGFFLMRHAAGDWGEVDAEDWSLNDQAVNDGTRLLSVYRTLKGNKLWVITEADRSVTTILLPDECALSRRSAEARCGLQVIDVRGGDVAHWLRIEGMVRELYDVVVLPGVRRPMALGFKSDEIQRTIAVDDESSL